MSKDVRPPVQMRRGTRVFSRVSTEDSDIPTSCEMKEEPAFKPLQGNLVLSIQDISVSIPLEAANSGALSIPISEGRLFLRCLWKVGIPLQWNPGNQLSSQDDMGCMELSSSSCADNGVPIDLRRVSQGILVVA